jgi:hypothetical protein
MAWDASNRCRPGRNALISFESAADGALVDLARAGSDDAFGILVGRYRAPVVRLAYRLTHDADEANDIAQDSFMRAYRRIGDFHPDRPFARWLFVIARMNESCAMSFASSASCVRR